MSASFTVNKEKRSKSSNDANNSFVKNVTSKMTGFLPSTITKWFSSPSSTNTNGSVPIAESTDSSTEDEAPESPITTQPPAKRMRYSSPGTSNTYIPPETKCTSTNTESIATYSEMQSPISRNAFRPESNFVSTKLHSPSEESINETKKEPFFYNLDSSLNENNSVLKKRKSLFNINHEENYVSNSTGMSLSEPQFKASYLSAPFYTRQAIYGRAISAYMNEPNIKQRKDTLVTNNSNDDNVAISHSARRVLDLLENYSSPLMEAKRISQFMKSSNNNTLDSSKASSSKGLSYKTQELHVPSIATILRLKQKSRLMDTTSAARQLMASHSSSPDFMAYPAPASQSNTLKETSDKLTTKIKSRLTRINREEKAVYESNEPINLPTAVLQIDKDNLPKFSLGIPTPKLIPSSSTVTATDFPNSLPPAVNTVMANIDKKINETNVDKGENTNNSSYQFSIPVNVSSETVSASSVPAKFTFGSPERTIEKTIDTKTDSALSKVHHPIIKVKTDLLPQSEDWKCEDCWVSNKPDSANCVCCGGKKPIKKSTKVNKCTLCQVVLDKDCTSKCVNCEKTSNNTGNSKLVSIDLSQWKCQDCWVKNDEGVENCVCCGSKKPNSEGTVANSKPESVESDWKCEVCLIKNKSSVETCAACGEVKPISKNPLTNNGKSAYQSKTTGNVSLLKNIIKSQTEKWECVNCLVRNDNNLSKCVCCETEKPGTIKESEKKSFNFGISPNMSFKFGIDPKLAENKIVEPTPVTLVTPAKESETNNNNLSNTFTFGLPKKKPSDKFNKLEETPGEISKPAYTFGIPKQTAESTSKNVFNNPVLGSKLHDEAPKSLTVINEEKDEAEIEQPKTPVSNIKPIGIFAAPVPAQTQTKTTETPVSSINSLNSLEKNDPQNPLLLSTSQSSAETGVPKTTFTFSSSGIRIASNLFSPQVTTTSTTTLQETPVSSSSSSLSFFQKSDPVTSSSLSFFQKSESTPATLSLFNKTETTITTTVSQPGVSGTPVFSFGSNNVPNVLAQPEQPKFNFSFGSTNKPDTPSLFKAPFGATADSNVGANNFTLTNANSMNTGNVLSGNTLGGLPGANNMTGNILSGGSGLPAVNPLSGLSGSNALGTANPLSGLVLSTNSLSEANNLSQTNISSTMQPGGLFGAAIKKDDMWSSSNNTSNNMFVSNATNNNAQKPAFNFGSSLPFNSNNANPAPTFGSPSQPTQNMFGISNQNSQPSLFSNQMQNSAPPNIFGAPQPASNSVPTVGMFGTPSTGVAPNFGSPNPIPTFEAPSMNPTPAPAFNFGAQQTTGIFGFGQQQQQQPQQQQHPGGVYNFGATPASAGSTQVQFNMGSSPYISGRRVRKAIRRTSQR
ncbi:nuclear pore complex protein Nup153 isoform X2 [Vanessa atalanta]|uniref:nuclear pore complex protein Nup153 isoform X2 n=1 Tax=Vanessa atalanta TaxID=42275 RepID=UPI001FCD9A49|nr:nuclear pore complex protein Nup153 isoform X2 [Vanessa atalanta]